MKIGMDFFQLSGLDSIDLNNRIQVLETLQRGAVEGMPFVAVCFQQMRMMTATNKEPNL